MAGLPDREAAMGVSETYQFLVGDSAFCFTVGGGSIELHDGRAEDPSVVVTTDEETRADIASGRRFVGGRYRRADPRRRPAGGEALGKKSSPVAGCSAGRERLVSRARRPWLGRPSRSPAHR